MISLENILTNRNKIDDSGNRSEQAQFRLKYDEDTKVKVSATPTRTIGIFDASKHAAFLSSFLHEHDPSIDESRILKGLLNKDGCLLSFDYKSEAEFIHSLCGELKVRTLYLKDLPAGIIKSNQSLEAVNSMTEKLLKRTNSILSSHLESLKDEIDTLKKAQNR